MFARMPRWPRLLRILLVALLVALAACRPAVTPAPPARATVANATPATPATPAAAASATPATPATPAAGATAAASVTAAASATPRASATPQPSATPRAPTETATAAPSATPDAYAGWTIADLRARSYGGGAIERLGTLAVTEAFTRTLIAYPSDGLTVRGFMNTPFGPGPFPVVVVAHGYVNPAGYQTLTYTTRYADALARAGFLVLHPDYRGHGQSQDGPNPFRAGYAVDVLNLIALLPGLPEADPQAVGLFGHSMGGGISIRVITVNPEVKAALLYGSMSADEYANYAKIAEWRGDPDLPELALPEADVARIAPLGYLDGIRAAVSIHHGDADATVPPEWSADLYGRLQALGKTVEYFSYAGLPHTFSGAGDALLLERAVAFFDRTLRAAP